MIVQKPFERNDFNTLISWFKSPEELIQACGKTFQYPVDEAQLEIYLSGAEAPKPVRKIFKFVDFESGEHVGNATLERINLTERSAAIACVIIGIEEYRGKGICELIMQSVIQFAFDELGLTKLTLNVFDFNSLAIKCYEKAGFKIVDRNDVKYLDKDYINIKMELNKAITNYKS
jgi:RimJ/RimL family protein N-acetyltransferase